MDRILISGDCARLLTRLTHLWQHHATSPTHAPNTLDAEIAETVHQLVEAVALAPEPLPETTQDGGVPVKLTPRERDVLHWLAKGKSVEDVSELMQISKCTVRTYIQRSLRKLDVSNRTHAVTRALRFGLIQL